MLRWKSFVTDETGALSLDWVVLTAVILATGASILGSIDGGFGVTNSDAASGLNGQVIERSFTGSGRGTFDPCNHGIEGLQAREAGRAGSGTSADDLLACDGD